MVAICDANHKTMAVNRKAAAPMHNTGLNIREIFHMHYGICQLVYFAGTGSWIGINEKKQSLATSDNKGYPNLDKLRRAVFLYREQIPYLEILNPHFKPDVMVLSLRRDQEITSA
jgi:hypothetical protein